MIVRRHFFIGFIGVLTMVALAPAVFAGVEPAGNDSVRVEADTITYEGKSDMVHATGNVGIRHQDYTLLSDKATLDVSADVLSVEGGVRIIREEGELAADRATVDMTAGTGTLYNGKLYIKEGNFRISGAVVEKQGEGVYHADKAAFTTCDSDTPSWKFTASEVDVTLEEYATGKNALLFIQDVPVFYLPYVVFPVMRERQSGFLIPRVGTSTKKGLYLDTAWYQAISPSQDATLSLDIQTRRGIGTGVEYRYIRSLSSSGQANGYLIFDKITDQWRGNIVQKHEEILSSSLYFKSSINAVTDRTFYKEYGEGAGEYNKKLLESTLFLTKHVDYYSITPQARYAQIVDRDDAGYTYQKLPVLTVKGIRQPIGGLPLYFSFSSDFTNFVREYDGDGFRGRIRPQLTYNFKPAPHVSAAVWGAVEGRAYSSYDRNGGSDTASDPAAGALASTTMYRTFATGKGESIRHMLVPQIEYAFSARSSIRRKIGFDNYDDPVAENRITYSIFNKLVSLDSREDGSTYSREILKLNVSQSLQFSGGRRDLTTPVDRTGSISDLRIDALANPTDWLGIRLHTRIRTTDVRFSTANIAADFHDKSGNSAAIGYRFTKGVNLVREGMVDVPDLQNPVETVRIRGMETTRFSVNYGEAKVKIISLQPFTFEYTGRFSIDRPAMLESLYSLEYRHQCWSVTLSYRDNFQANEFLVSLNLAGLGSVGKVKAF